MYYRVVLYKNNKMLPNLFINYESADNFIFTNHLHAYITIKEGEI